MRRFVTIVSVAQEASGICRVAMSLHTGSVGTDAPECCDAIALSTQFANAFVLDLETTGLRPLHDRITQICVKRFILPRAVPDSPPENSSQPVSAAHATFCEFVNPGDEVPIPVRVTEVTGLTHARLAAYDGFGAVGDRFLQWLRVETQRVGARDCVFVAHNGRTFDYPLLLAELRRHGHSAQAEEVLGPFTFMDTLVAARSHSKQLRTKATEAGKNPAVQVKCDDTVERAPPTLSWSLGVWFAREFGEPIANAHDAEGDVDALGRLLAGSADPWPRVAVFAATETVASVAQALEACVAREEERRGINGGHGKGKRTRKRTAPDGTGEGGGEGAQAQAQAADKNT
jgi:DNA polymerase III epsilon subunit-like protein